MKEATSESTPTRLHNTPLLRFNEYIVEKRLMSIDYLNILYLSFSKLYRDKDICTSFFKDQGFDPSVVDNIVERDRNERTLQKVQNYAEENLSQILVDSLDNPNAAYEDTDVFKLHFIMGKVNEYYSPQKIQQHNRTLVKKYIKSKSHSENKIRKAYNYLYILNYYASDLKERFEGESSLTYLRIQELTGDLLKHQKHHAEEAVRISEFDFCDEIQLKGLLKGGWSGMKKGEKFVGNPGKENQRQFRYEGVKSIKDAVDDFLKLVKRSELKKKKTQTNK